MWQHLWTAARFRLQLSTEEFLALTPAQFEWMIRERRRLTEAEEFMLAQLTASVINFGTCRPKKPVAAKDFMPSQWAKEQPAAPRRKRLKPRKQIEQDIHNVMRHFMGARRG